ncbi:hypothetical protein Gogos_012930, partial [Gossypium gossypioides]|nr:hypothetical protein [Gossypium gossypioides]
EEWSFDFVFVDAYKSDYLKFHELTLKLVKVRGIIAYDNTLWYELVAQSEKEVVEDLIKRYQNFVIEFNSFIVANPRVDLSLLSIGNGFTLCRRNDASLKAQNQAHEHDGLKFSQGPITTSKSKQIRARLNETIQDFVTKALDTHTTEKENQDSLSCFQENQETKSWSNFAVSDYLKN